MLAHKQGSLGILSLVILLNRTIYNIRYHVDSTINFPYILDTFRDMRIVLDTNISEDLVCFACKALNGDSELPCWSLTNDSIANQSILSQDIGHSSIVPSDGGLYRQTCNSTQRFCKV